MSSYRVEISGNSRAACQNAKCKDGDKIQKGEIRQGVMVKIKEHESMRWRHWGCVTPTVLKNWWEAAGEDLTMVDGYEELPEDAQEKVRKALEEGHVDDDDWNGDEDMNRYNPGNPRQGMYSTESKSKKAKKGDVEDDAVEKKPAKKRGRKPADVGQDEKPAKKARGKKAKDEAADEDEPAPPPAKKGRPKKAKAEVEDDDVAPVADKKTKGKKSKSAVTVQDSDDEPIQPAKPAAKRGRPKKAPANEDEADAAEPKAKLQKRKAKAKKTAVEKEDDE